MNISTKAIVSNSEMIKNYKACNVREITDKPKILVPVILQEVECVTNAAIESIELDQNIRIWVPELMKL